MIQKPIAMKAEEVYNIAIHLPEKELERLCTLLEKRVCNIKKVCCKPPKKKFITDEEARNYLVRTVFRTATN